MGRKGILFLSFIFIIRSVKSQTVLGGTVTGKSSGIIDWSKIGDASSYTWDITVEEGNVIELYFHTFEMTECTGASGCDLVATCKHNLKLTDERDTLFCNRATKPPSPVVVSNGNRVVLVATKRDNLAYSVFITWRARPASSLCCGKVTAISADANSKFNTEPNLKTWLGTYTVSQSLTTSDGLYPVYVKDDNREQFLSHMETGYVRPWTLSTSEFGVGGNKGVMFFGPEGICPPILTVASTYDYVKTDNTFEKEDKKVSFDCATECTEPAPTQPPNTDKADVAPAPAKKGDVTSYKCKQQPNFKVISRCQSNGKWSPLAGACPAPPVTTSPLLLPGTQPKVLNATHRCVTVKTAGWPRQPYTSGVTVWRFKAVPECSAIYVTFDQETFDIRGSRAGLSGRLCTSGDRVVILKDNNVRKIVCGSVAPSVAVDIDNDEQIENRIELRADSADFGNGFMAEVCAVDCGGLRSRARNNKMKEVVVDPAAVVVEVEEL